MNSEGLLVAVLSSSCIFLFLVCASAEKVNCFSLCGSTTNISYPFRLRGDPINCGVPQNELICQNNRTLLNISSKLYDVREIFYENKTIRLIDPGLQSNNCSSLPKYSWNGQDRYLDSPYSFYSRDDYSISIVSYVTCKQPVENDDSYIPTSPCINSTSNEYQYVRLEETSAVDVRQNCSYSGPEVPMDFTINGNSSYFEIWQDLLVGFYLSWSDEERTLCGYAGGTYSYDNLGYAKCHNFCSRALQSTHCFFQYVWKTIRGTAVKFVNIAGYILIARGAPGMLCLLSFVIYKWHKQRRSKNENVELFLAKYGDLTPTRYSYADIKRMTGGFQITYADIKRMTGGFKITYANIKRMAGGFKITYADIKRMAGGFKITYADIKSMTGGFKTKLGQGGFGSVYKGVLHSGRPVAIKILSKSRGNGEDFINEVATIGRIHHVNVVQLIGFCSEGSKRALVYDYMPNGSLDKYVYSRDDQNSTALDLARMYEIALGIARGIAYLHRGCEMQILHFDIKPHNILLDANFTPKISDFGLAKLYPTGKSAISMTAPKGTPGFIAPELVYRNLGRISYKSDVYSFGRLLLEMIAKVNRSRVDDEQEYSSQFYFPLWLYDRLLKGEEFMIDAEMLESESTATKKLVMVGLWCIQICPDDRPSMKKVVEMLEGNLDDLALPPRPSLLFPSEINEVCEIEISEDSYIMENNSIEELHSSR